MPFWHSRGSMVAIPGAPTRSGDHAAAADSDLYQLAIAQAAAADDADRALMLVEILTVQFAPLRHHARSTAVGLAPNRRPAESRRPVKRHAIESTT